AAAAERGAFDRQRRRDGQYRWGGVPVPRVLAEYRVPDLAAVAAPAADHAPGGGGILLRASRRFGHRPAIHQTLGLLRLRSRGPGGRGGGRTVQGVGDVAGRLARGRAVRAVLFHRETPVSARAVWVSLLLCAGPAVRPAGAQDTATIDRGVRIGIIYRPGVRPGLVVLPARGAGGEVAGAAAVRILLDSVRTIMNRDLDLSDRFELITLPGGDSIRGGRAAPGASAASRSTAGTGHAPGAGTAAAAVPTLNYPLYQALGADFALDPHLAA